LHYVERRSIKEVEFQIHVELECLIEAHVKVLVDIEVATKKG